ncbi:MAG: MFS transporter [Desulfocurvibacter africanus]
MTSPAKPRPQSMPALLTGLALSGLAAGAFSFAYPLTTVGLASAPLAPLDGASWIGAAFSIYFLAKLAAAPVMGWLADRMDGYGRSGASMGTLMALACVFASALPLLFLAARSVGKAQMGLLLVQAGLGLCAGASRPLALASAAGPASAAPAGRRLAQAALANQLAFLLAPLLGGLILAGRDIQSVLAFLSVGMLAAALFFFLALPRCTRTFGPPMPGTAASHPDPVRPRLLPALRAALTDPLAARLLPAVAGRAMGIAVWAAFLPMFLTASLPRDPLLFGLLFSLPSLAVCLGLPLTGRLADGPYALRWAAGGMLISALGLLALPLLPSTIWAVAISGLAAGLGSAASLPASLGLAASSGPGRATHMAVYQSAASLGFVVGPLLGILAVRAFGTAEAALGLAGLCGVLCCLPLLAGTLPMATRSPILAGIVALVLILAAMPLRRDAHPPATGLPLVRNAAAASISGAAYQYADLAMGTIVRLSLEAPDRHMADAAADKAFELIRALQGDLDLRNPHGSVGRVNLNAGRAPAQVSPEAYGVIERGLAWGRLTDGAFDISVGAVSRVAAYWGLDPWYARAQQRLVDYRKVVLDPVKRTVFLPEAGMALDLGGLAKGAIIDATVELLRRSGVAAGIVEAGGDMYCFGTRAWRVGIENPRGPGLLGSTLLRERGICGSGDYRRFAPGDDPRSQGRRHHVLDPRSLSSVSGSAAVTVLAENAETADALATALLVLGPERGMEFLGRELGAAALWVHDDLTLIASPNFPALASIPQEALK